MLFLDEIVANLDQLSCYILYEKLVKMIENENGVLISISHDIEGMKVFHDRLFKLDVKNGRVVECEWDTAKEDKG